MNNALGTQNVSNPSVTSAAAQVAGLGPIFVICKGNTCRSPMCQALLKKALVEAGLGHEVVSAGTIKWVGDPAAEHSVRAMKEVAGIDISEHRSTQFNVEKAKRASLLIVVDDATVPEVKALVGENLPRIIKWREFLDKADVANPFKQGYEVYDRVLRESIMPAVPSLVDFIRSQIVGPQVAAQTPDKQ